MKHTYQHLLPGGALATLRTDRTYTHVVVATRTHDVSWVHDAACADARCDRGFARNGRRLPCLRKVCTPLDRPDQYIYRWSSSEALAHAGAREVHRNCPDEYQVPAVVEVINGGTRAPAVEVRCPGCGERHMVGTGGALHVERYGRCQPCEEESDA